MNNNYIESLSNNKVPLIIFLFFLFFLVYIIQKMNVNSENCKNITSIRNSDDYSLYNSFYNHTELIDNGYFFGTLSIQNKNYDYEYKLKDFYIKTAYNCFCNGKFKNDYVNKCALINCASYGVRALDMQVFSLNGEPIIASNTVNTNLYKETYNHITLNDGLAEINKVFFSDSYFIDGVSNNLKNDPLFLILRLHYGSVSSGQQQSFNDKKINFYNKIYNIITSNLDANKFNSTNLRQFYSNDDYAKKRSTIISNIPMESLTNKIFLFVILNDEPNTNVVEKSKLSNLVDLYGSSNELKTVRFDDISEGGSFDLNVNKTKNNLTFCMPPLDFKNNNYDFVIPMSFGVQFIGMNFQNQDNNLLLYNKFFIEQYGDENNTVTSPYIKKPDHMIDIPLIFNDQK